MSPSWQARCGLILCATTVGLNVLLVLVSLVPAYVLMPDSVSMVLFALPLLLVVGRMFFGHVRASPALNRIGGPSSERKAANKAVMDAIMSQVSPRWRPGFVVGCLVASAISAIAMRLGPDGQPTRHGNVYLLNRHGSYTTISEAQYRFDAAMWQAGFAAVAVIVGLIGILVYLARPGDRPREWTPPGTHVPRRDLHRRVWPFRQAQSAVEWVWPYAAENGVLRRYGPLTLVAGSFVYIATFSYAFVNDWLG